MCRGLFSWGRVRGEGGRGEAREGEREEEGKGRREEKQVRGRETMDKKSKRWARHPLPSLPSLPLTLHKLASFALSSTVESAIPVASKYSARPHTRRQV